VSRGKIGAAGRGGEGEKRRGRKRVNGYEKGKMEGRKGEENLPYTHVVAQSQ